MFYLVTNSIKFGVVALFSSQNKRPNPNMVHKKT